jgi:hypothetical protein
LDRKLDEQSMKPVFTRFALPLLDIFAEISLESHDKPVKNNPDILIVTETRLIYRPSN